MPAENDSQGFRRVLISIDLVYLDDDGGELPTSERMWRPHIIVDLGERDPETELTREAAVDFATFNEAFAWVFHEMALACLELDFAGRTPPRASKFPDRVPDLPLSTDAGVQQVVVALVLADVVLADLPRDAEESDDFLNEWFVFIDVHRERDEEPDPDWHVFGTDVADAFHVVCKWAEVAFTTAAPTSLSYPRSETVFTGNQLDQAPDRPLGGLRFVSLGAIFDDEQALEEHFAKNPDQLYEGFWLVGRQLSLGTKKADLVGLDGRGALVVIELKHGMPDREAMAQVIEYAGFLSHMNLADLSQHLATQPTSSGIEPIADFATAYRERYGHPPYAGIPVRPALVSTGLDEYDVRSIAYLRASGVPLDFFLLDAAEGSDGRAIAIRRNPLLTPTKQWYVPRDLNRRERTAWILNEASQLNAGPLYQRLYDLIGECLQPSGSWVPRERPDSLGLCRSLSSRRSGGGTSQRECLVMRIYGHSPAAVLVFLYDELIQLAPRKTKTFLRLVRGRPDGIPGKTSGYSFWMTEADWDRHGDEFRDLLAYMGKRWREKIGK